MQKVSSHTVWWISDLKIFHLFYFLLHFIKQWHISFSDMYNLKKDVSSHILHCWNFIVQYLFVSLRFDGCFQTTDCLFLLENICYSLVWNGYEIFGHVRTKDDVISSLREIVGEAVFKKECSKYCKILAMKTPLVLPSVIPTEFKRIVNTISRWCQITGKSHYVKGFVLHSFLIKDLYLKICNDELDCLSRKLNVEVLPTTASTSVYNPKQRICFDKNCRKWRCWEWN